MLLLYKNKPPNLRESLHEVHLFLMFLSELVSSTISIISNEVRNLVWRRKICYVGPNDEMAMSKDFSVANAPSK